MKIVPIEATFGIAEPTDVVVNTAIELLRIKHNIVVYDYMPPFVHPTSKKIIFCYAVKQCNIRDGWNGRIFIGKSEYLDDPLECKCQAINLAIDFINKNK